MTTETIILAGGLLLLAAVLSSLLADRAGVPTLLLFLVVGMLAGSEGVGGIAFDSPVQAFGGGLLFQVIAGLVLGAAAGFAFGFCASVVVNRIRLSVQGFYPMLVLATGGIAFGAADLVGGNPFLSVYVAWLVLVQGASLVSSAKLLRVTDREKKGAGA